MDIYGHWWPAIKGFMLMVAAYVGTVDAEKSGVGEHDDESRDRDVSAWRIRTNDRGQDGFGTGYSGCHLQEP